MLPKSLLEGYGRFRRGRYAQDEERYRQLAEQGQSPPAMVIACCDSRVDVSAIFDVGPGELFVVRNVANLVPPFDPDGVFHSTSAAVEFAVAGLKVPNIIVLGHSQCGGVAAYRKTREGEPDETRFIGRWLTVLDGLDVNERDESAFGRERAFELAGVRQSLANLRTFDTLKDLEAAGRIALHGLHFEIASGAVLALDEEADSFAPLPEEA